MMHSSQSPAPSSCSLHPPLSPGFFPLSPLLPQSASSAASSASRRSTSPLLLSALPPSSSLTSRLLSTSVASLSSSFLTDVAIRDAASELSSGSRQPLATLPRSVFTHSSTSASSSSSSSSMLSLPAQVMLQPSSSFDMSISPSPLVSPHLGAVEHDDDDEQQRDGTYPFRIGPLDVLSDVVSSAESVADQTTDTAPQTPQSDASGASKKKVGPDGEKRVARACIHCSASKTKCDNKRPCGRCVRTKRSATCQDIPRRKRNGRSKRRRETEGSDASEARAHEHVSAEAVKNEETEASVSTPVMAKCATPNELHPNSGSHMVTYPPHTMLAPHDSYPTSYSHQLPFSPQPMQPAYEHSNQPHHVSPQDYSAHYWPHPHHAHPHTQPHTHSYSYSHIQAQSAAHSVFALPGQYAARGQQEPSYPPPRHAHTTPASSMLSPIHASTASPTSAGSFASSSTAPPPSPATSRSTAASASAAVPIGQVLTRLRNRLPRALHRAHGAVIDQFHHWSDTLQQRQQQGLSVPVPLLKARQYVYHMLKDAMVALEDEDRQRRMAALLSGNSTGSSPPPPTFSPPLESEHEELLRLIHQEWNDHLFPCKTAAAAEDDEASGDEWNNKDKTSAPTLDSILQRRVVTPTFIIPLLSFPFLTSAPWLSASFSSLLGYDAQSLSGSTLSPLSLLHHRQHADIAPLVPAFLSAITARADHYLHSSGWKRQAGDSVQLMANVRVMYADGTGYPVALMAQFTRKEEADDSFAPILARMNNVSSANGGGSSVSV